jgi:hypothetical protein
MERDLMMERETQNEKRLVQYLLGQMSQEEETRIEEQYLSDPDFHDELRATERDLIDRYVYGEFPNPEQFEKSFMASPTRRRKVEFAMALKQAAVAKRQELSWRDQIARLVLQRQRVWIPVAAALVIVVGGSLLLMNRPQPTVPSPIVEQEPPTPPVVQPEPTLPTPPVRVVAFVLTPSLVRSTDETQTLTIEKGTDVSLELPMETVDYASYRVVLRTVEGKEIWNQDRLTAQRTVSGQTVIVRLPSSRFTNEDYIVRLAGVASSGDTEDVHSYYFRAKMR